jgi:hypothetical protein
LGLKFLYLQPLSEGMKIEKILQERQEGEGIFLLEESKNNL